MKIILSETTVERVRRREKGEISPNLPRQENRKSDGAQAQQIQKSEKGEEEGNQKASSPPVVLSTSSSEEDVLGSERELREEAEDEEEIKIKIKRQT